MVLCCYFWELRYSEKIFFTKVLSFSKYIFLYLNVASRYGHRNWGFMVTKIGKKSLVH